MIHYVLIGFRVKEGGERVGRVYASGGGKSL